MIKHTVKMESRNIHFPATQNVVPQTTDTESEQQRRVTALSHIVRKEMHMLSMRHTVWYEQSPQEPVSGDSFYSSRRCFLVHRR